MLIGVDQQSYRKMNREKRCGICHIESLFAFMPGERAFCKDEFAWALSKMPWFDQVF